ncbi:hypothetical protein CEXT_74251 [Caerostris extrusa]|uniref:Uncharacterized protein n=1 Tax=Caerostris extrusa TaxID=172846 RepID=A0AAV4SKH5_CAEEX|nr:hypothetical protein CEXT_74251 [Caerostris extrusa]
MLHFKHSTQVHTSQKWLSDSISPFDKYGLLISRPMVICSRYGCGDARLQYSKYSRRRCSSAAAPARAAHASQAVIELMVLAPQSWLRVWTLGIGGGSIGAVPAAGSGHSVCLPRVTAINHAAPSSCHWRPPRLPSLSRQRTPRCWKRTYRQRTWSQRTFNAHNGPWPVTEPSPMRSHAAGNGTTPRAGNGSP